MDTGQIDPIKALYQHSLFADEVDTDKDFYNILSSSSYEDQKYGNFTPNRIIPVLVSDGLQKQYSITIGKGSQISFPKKSMQYKVEVVGIIKSLPG